MPEDTIEHLPSSLPEGLKVELKGFDKEVAEKAGNAIAALVETLSQYLPLSNLVGVTVSFEYDKALAAVDVGYEGKNSAQATHDNELGHGVAMAVPVIANGMMATHLVFGPHVVELFASEEESDKRKGCKLIAHELAHAADHELKRLALGEIWNGPIDDLIPDSKNQFIWELSHFVWDEYYASRISVIFDDEEEPWEDELFSNSHLVFMKRLRQKRREYHLHNTTLEEFIEVLKHNLRMVLKSTGYLLGLADGKDKPIAEIAPLSAPLFNEDEGKAIFAFHAVLLDLWECRGEWKSYDEFLELNTATELLLDTLDIYVSNTEEGYIHIDIPPSDEWLELV